MQLIQIQPGFDSLLFQTVGPCERGLNLSVYLSFNADSRDASLVLTTVNDTTCFNMPVYLQCNHPDPTSNVEGNPVFYSNRVNWKKDGAVIAVDGSTYQIIQQGTLSTILAVTYHREDYRNTSSNFNCFFPLSNGTLLESNEVKVHLNVSCKCMSSLYTTIRKAT